MADVLNVALVSTESKLYGRPLQGVVEEIESRVNPVDQKIGVVSARVQVIEQRPAPQLSIEGNRTATDTSSTGAKTKSQTAAPNPHPIKTQSTGLPVRVTPRTST